MSKPATHKPDVSLGDFLANAPGDSRLPAGVLGLIIEDWGDRDVQEVAALNVYATAKELRGVMPDPVGPGNGDETPPGYDNDDRFNAAEAIHDLIRRGGLTPSAPAEPHADKPLTVHVDLPKSPEQMDLRELLTLLAGDPGRFGELASLVEGKVQMQAASRATRGLCAIPRRGGGLDVDATLAYISQVSRPYAVAQRTFQGQRPVRLSAALGLDERALIHPFTGYPVQGPDSNEFDWSELPALHPGLHEALLWAQISGHPAWPQQPDVFTFSEQVFQKRLPKRWQLILDDYSAALAAGDEDARIITRFWPEGLSLESAIDIARSLPGADRGGPARRSSAPDYERLVREAATARGHLQASGMSTSYSGGAYTSATISGMSIRLSSIVVTGIARITGMNVSGTLLLVPGASVHDSGMSNQVVVTDISWERAAQILDLA